MTTTDPFTEAARAYAQERYPSCSDLDRDRRMVVDEFTEWARTHLAAQEQDTAQIIDDHRVGSRFVGFGVTITCTCGESVRGEGPVGPQTDEDNAHRDAERKHAAHVADMLARRDEEKR